MGKLPEQRLVIEPGMLKILLGQGTVQENGAGISSSADTASALSWAVPQWDPAQKDKVLRQLAGQPGELYDLLQGKSTGSMAELQLLPPGLERADSGTETGAALPGWAGKQLLEEPLLGFRLRGMSKEELLEGVFALWAEEEYIQQDEGSAAPASMLAAELARLERKGPAVTTGGWLAEAAAEGSLHQPGPLFHELASRPFPVSPAVAQPDEDWMKLLPNTPRAGEGLALIMRKAAESARRRASEPGRQ
ncbi:MULTISPECIES: hypothetical protein [unclassified Paenibacillus]|uniref:hypothetical protein n=1 Tax=unclassified Paenibacillus TaxID=185978 RepID=UPI00240618C7|nr:MULTISPECIES: hypothetical protein [unclassified Paenibacillus]MDF9843408.1 hypothetical protein [Paenibacillus sp. PastF-2]MDF9849995.1 hypothetical protein [Paenibacillus sp. PastM-2]MDF9856703.1 hypothetical protein [Paenibacillus sp. PastF-1]MDH6481974.1 hypothetical protein [Paenibacillus sp. PastH-2]MDH6509398.1 hypothetical protein [Paenibacillus sp. PastM-3]